MTTSKKLKSPLSLNPDFDNTKRLDRARAFALEFATYDQTPRTIWRIGDHYTIRKEGSRTFDTFWNLRPDVRCEPRPEPQEIETVQPGTPKPPVTA